MNTPDVSSGHVCPRCRSTKTIRVERCFAHEAWHCYSCRHSFDRGLEPRGQRLTRANRQRRKTDRRNNG